MVLGSQTDPEQTVGVSVFQILKETVEGVSVALEQQFLLRSFVNRPCSPHPFLFSVQSVCFERKREGGVGASWAICFWKNV